MTDIEYINAAENLLDTVERTCDALNASTDADIDNQRMGGMLTLQFSNQSQIIINLQKPLHEIWMAAQAGGFHYANRDGRWLDTKTGKEFFADLSLYASEQAAQSVVFSALS